GERLVGVFRSFVIEKYIDGNRARLRTLDPVDQARELTTRPRPGSVPAKALLVDGDDERGTLYGDRSGKPKSEIVGGGIQFCEISGPGQQQDRNCHEKTGGYRS